MSKPCPDSRVAEGAWVAASYPEREAPPVRWVARLGRSEKRSAWIPEGTESVIPVQPLPEPFRFGQAITGGQRGSCIGMWCKSAARYAAFRFEDTVQISICV